MTRFELRTSGVVIGRSTNLATTTAQIPILSDSNLMRPAIGTLMLVLLHLRPIPKSAIAGVDVIKIFLEEI